MAEISKNFDKLDAYEERLVPIYYKALIELPFNRAVCYLSIRVSDHQMNNFAL